MTLRVEEVGDLATLGARRDEWNVLLESSPYRDIFQTWEWISAWLAGFWARKPILFLFVRDGARLIGIVPLVHDIDGVLGCRNAFVLPVNAHVRRMDVIWAAGADPTLVVDAALEHLRESRGRARVALRQGLDLSPAASCLPDVARQRGLASQSLDSSSSPIVRIESDWDTYLSARAARTRQELRRKVKRAETNDHLTWSVVSSSADMPQALDAVLAIERQSWKEAEGTSFTAEPGLELFYADVATRFASAGWLRVFLLHAGDVPVAHIFGAEYGGEYFALKTSYDSAFRASSPGLVLFHHALRDAFMRRLKVFDFLGDPAPWKSEFANDERRHRRVCAFARRDVQCTWCAFRDGTARPFARHLTQVGRSSSRSPRIPATVNPRFARS